LEIVIGSASWRSRYGNFNKNLISAPEMQNLLSKSFELGIKDIDTAPSYGDCESKLGLIKPSQKISSKLILTNQSEKQVEAEIVKILKRIKRETLDTLFIHNWDALSQVQKARFFSFLLKIKEQGLFTNIGISTYEIDNLIDLYVELEAPVVIQINSSVIDQRLLMMLSKMQELEIDLSFNDIWVRSIFLQGVLLSNSDQNPFNSHPAIVKFFAFCQVNNLEFLQVCLDYLKILNKFDCIKKAVIGIHDLDSLNQIYNFFTSPQLNLQYIDISSDDLALIDPRKW
jgi:aryl-alcohol dehydrogenase-like predicted oxidoreductase